jgi:hypothetical protein
LLRKKQPAVTGVNGLVTEAKAPVTEPFVLGTGWRDSVMGWFALVTESGDSETGVNALVKAGFPLVTERRGSVTGWNALVTEASASVTGVKGLVCAEGDVKRFW